MFIDYIGAEHHEKELYINAMKKSFKEIIETLEIDMQIVSCLVVVQLTSSPTVRKKQFWYLDLLWTGFCYLQKLTVLLKFSVLPTFFSILLLLLLNGFSRV